MLTFYDTSKVTWRHLACRGAAGSLQVICRGSAGGLQWACRWRAGGCRGAAGDFLQVLGCCLVCVKWTSKQASKQATSKQQASTCKKSPAAPLQIWVFHLRLQRYVENSNLQVLACCLLACSFYYTILYCTIQYHTILYLTISYYISLYLNVSNIAWNIACFTLTNDHFYVNIESF